MAFLDPNAPPVNQSILPGAINDTTSPSSPFGPSSSNTAFVKSAENPDESVRNVSSAGNRKITPDDDGAVSAKTYVGSGPTLYYPVENDNPAYQARVTFKVYSLQTKMDGETLKGFTKHVTDNLKVTSKSEDIDPGGDVFGQDVYSDGFEEFGEDFADASGPGANSNALTTKAKRVGQNITTFVKDKVTGNAVAEQTAKIFKGGVDFRPTPNMPIVDMYFPLTMQFNDNAQYDNADLGAMGGTAEAAIQAGAGALNSVLGAASQGVGSIFDAITGNKQLSETALRVGAARAIDLGSFLNTGVANALRLTNRTVINPNTRALFRGVNLREFTFQFKMIAESQQEAAIVEQIVKHFRTQMYPDTYPVNIGNNVSADLGFAFPNVFEITFKYKNGENTRIPKIHFCYLRNVSTTINPTGGTFRRDGQPNEIDLTLSFVEYRTLNKKDIKAGY
mgnify:CR=1 FL=1|tara:strand:- start:2651 stop:3997 length:1347 start_codon:yes stop_codon:yes gene_type:complete